jgi:hypothetical protein
MVDELGQLTLRGGVPEARVSDRQQFRLLECLRITAGRLEARRLERFTVPRFGNLNAFCKLAWSVSNARWLESCLTETKATYGRWQMQSFQ